MLGKLSEKIIFIVIFIVSIIFLLRLSTQIKENYLPINIDKKPEDVIEEKYGYLSKDSYKYAIINDYMFVCIDSNNGYCFLDFAFRNDYSGFMFEIPGLKNTYYRNILGDVNINDKSISYQIAKIRGNYIIIIYSFFDKIKGLDFYNNERPMNQLTLDGTDSIYWFDVISDISTDFEVYGIYNDNRIKAIESNDIKEFYGEE